MKLHHPIRKQKHHQKVKTSSALQMHAQKIQIPETCQNKCKKKKKKRKLKNHMVANHTEKFTDAEKIRTRSKEELGKSKKDKKKQKSIYYVSKYQLKILLINPLYARTKTIVCYLCIYIFFLRYKIHLSLASY